MSLANFTDFKLSFWNGSAWTSTYNTTDFENITDLSNAPSGASKLEPVSNVGTASLNRVGGQLVEVDSGGFWLGFTFDLYARNTAGQNVFYGLLDKTQAKHADNPFFRLYPDVVNNASDYYEVHYKSFQYLYMIEAGTRGGRFVFLLKEKQTAFTQL